MDERLYWLWLSAGLGPGAHGMQALMETYEESAEAVFASRMELLRRGLVTPAQQRSLTALSPENMQARLALHEAKNIAVLCYSDLHYPEALREIDTPPPVLYATGEPRYLKAELPIGMIGTRRPSAYGIEAARLVADGLAAGGATLVSGLADGLDSEAHKAAVRGNAPTIAVLGTAIDVTFPARNATLRGLVEQRGVCVSELPVGTAGQGAYFLLRNRLIAGLSKGLCVIEARKRSGTMSTVRFALDYGRDVFAVPGSIFSPLSEGTNSLIADGARPIASAADVLAEYLPPEELARPEAPIPAQQELVLLSDAAQKMAEALSAQPQPIAVLCEKAGLPFAAALAALSELELAGSCEQQPGRQFLKK